MVVLCGIISYLGEDNAIPALVEGIKKLEYRGYDSFGCAFLNDGKLMVEKDVGKVSEVLGSHKINEYRSSIGIFHTRWATHGGIERRNAHPHKDCSGRIAVAHNGIVENWRLLKGKLVGHTFMSDTDTEVIVHMIEEGIKSGQLFYDSTLSAFRMLTGSSSFVAMHSDLEELIAVKNGSPLILAIARDGYFVSSDIPSVLKFTNRIVYLHDGDAVRISKEGYWIENIFGKSYEHKIYNIDAISSDDDKGKFKHFMEKEIYEQLSIWESLSEFNKDSIIKASDEIKKSGRVYLLGSGTSHYASLYGAKILRDSGIDAMAVEPHDIPSFSKIIKPEDLFLIISQSGETADTISVLDYFRANRKIGIINVQRSFLSRVVDVLIPMGAGVEKAVAATKSLTNTLIILTFISDAISGQIERAVTDANLLALNEFNLAVPSVEEAIEEVAKALCNEEKIFVAGKGEGFILALEGALKLKEVTYIHAEAMDLSSLKHGPLALIEKGTKVITIMTGICDEESMYNVEELKARGATVIGISTKNSSNYDIFIRSVPAGSLGFAPILFIMQLLSYKIALKRGIDPDKPRNLAKSVTVK